MINISKHSNLNFKGSEIIMSVEFVVDDNKELEIIKGILGDKYLIKKYDNKLICKKKHHKTLVRVALANEMKYISFEIQGSIDFDKSPLEDFLKYRQAISVLAQNCNDRIAVIVVETSKILYTTDGDTFVLSNDYSIHHYATDTIRRNKYKTAK